MKHGAECVSSNFPGLGLPIDSYLILQEGSLLLGEVEVIVDCGCLQSNPWETEQLCVGYIYAEYTAVRGKISFQ